MNCFICGKEMTKDYDDSPYLYCYNENDSNAHHITFKNEILNFKFDNSERWYALDFEKLTFYFATNNTMPINDIDITSMIYWTTSKELENYANKIEIFQS